MYVKDFLDPMSIILDLNGEPKGECKEWQIVNSM
jgi:hypothetical protein